MGTLARRHGISPAAVRKRRKRRTTTDARMKPKEACYSTSNPE